MAVLTDVYKRVLFDPDGEGIDGTDFNELQSAAAAQLLENLMISAVPDLLDEPSAPGLAGDLEDGQNWNAIGFAYTDVVFAPCPGAGYVRAGASARELVSVPGPLLAVISEPFDGAGEAVASFRLGVTTVTTAIGHATLPRIDLIEVRLEYIDADPTLRDFEDAVTRAPTSQTTNKSRRAQLTIQARQGAPSATPAYPTPTTGFVALAAVYVPALHDAVHDPANIRDLRFPLGGLQVIDVLPKDFYTPGSNPWTVAEQQFAAYAATTGTDPLYAFCPVGAKTARLVGLGLYGSAGNDAACDLVRMTYGPIGASVTELAETIDLWDQGFRKMSSVQLMDQLAQLAPAKGARASNTRVGSPIWCNGYPGGAAVDGSLSRLALRIRSEDVSYVSFVRFYVLTGS